MEVFELIHRLRPPLVRWFHEHATRSQLECVLQQVYDQAMGRSGPLLCWGYIGGAENIGRFTTSTSPALVQQKVAGDPEVPMLADGDKPVELNLQTMQLTVKGYGQAL